MVMFKRGRKQIFSEKTTMDDGWESTSDLNERELDVIEVIETEDLTRFTFEGIKRRLKIHPETLSRTLNRLTQDEIVKKVNNGYSLTAKGKQLLKPNQTSNRKEIPVLQSCLPPDCQIKKITASLEGKWFGNLRWMGYGKSNENIKMKWITNDGEIIVTVVFNNEMFYIYSKTISEIDFSSAVNVAYQLMGHVTKLISKSSHN